MAKLNDADAIYMGAAGSEKIYLGATEIWTPPPPVPTTGWFGIKTFEDSPVGGDTNRCALDRFVMADTGTITGIFIHCGVGTTTGANFKGLIYADNGSDFPGARLGVGAATAAPAGGGWVGSFLAAGPTIGPGVYWIGAVTDSFEINIDFLTSGTSPNSQLWLDFASYATPPATAPSPSYTSYPVDLCVYAEYNIT